MLPMIALMIIMVMMVIQMLMLQVCKLICRDQGCLASLLTVPTRLARPNMTTTEYRITSEPENVKIEKTVSEQPEQEDATEHNDEEMHVAMMMDDNDDDNENNDVTMLAMLLSISMNVVMIFIADGSLTDRWLIVD